MQGISPAVCLIAGVLLALMPVPTPAQHALKPSYVEGTAPPTLFYPTHNLRFQKPSFGKESVSPKLYAPDQHSQKLSYTEDTAPPALFDAAAATERFKKPSYIKKSTSPKLYVPDQSSQKLSYTEDIAPPGLFVPSAAAESFKKPSFTKKNTSPKLYAPALATTAQYVPTPSESLYDVKEPAPSTQYAPAQRLVKKDSHVEATEKPHKYEPTFTASDVDPKKWKVQKKASEDWELTGKRRRQQQQAYAKPAPAYTEPKLEADHLPDSTDLEQETASSVHGGSSSSWGGADESAHDGSRIQFHVSGHKGPKSYRFGYDTGKGPHRQFRYEERDAHGQVHGRYGYHDKAGMHVYHYSADPHDGFHLSEADPKHY